jgi:hypothetical protein
MLMADGFGDYLNGGDDNDVMLLGSASLSEILMLFSATG